MTTDSVSKFDDATMCRIIRESLEGLLTKLTPAFKPVRVKEVRFDDTSVLVDFYAASRDSMSVKNEIAAVTGALSGLLKTNELTERPVLHYGIRAWENEQSWLTYAICSAETAKKIGQGNSLDWLRGTEFQENTLDWRLARAKALTSRVEIALRDVVDNMLRQAIGPSWWPSAMRGKLDGIRRGAERQATRAGATTPSSREFLDYTYLSDLKEIAHHHWTHVGPVWADQSSFETRMNRLNVLRRSEAHNRPLMEQELVELEAIHDWMLDAIATVYPDVVPAYLLEKWRLSLASVAKRLGDSWGGGPVSRDIGDNIQRLSSFAERAARAVSELEQMLVPPGKDNLHRQLLKSVRHSVSSSREMIEAVKRGDVSAVENGFAEFRRAMAGIRSFEEAFLLSQ